MPTRSGLMREKHWRSNMAHRNDDGNLMLWFAIALAVVSIAVFVNSLPRELSDKECRRTPVEEVEDDDS